MHGTSTEKIATRGGNDTPTTRRGRPYTVRETARLLGIQPRDVQRLIKRHELAADGIGAFALIPGEAILARLQPQADEQVAS